VNPIPAISVRQPWAWLILFGGKDIENRTWLTRLRGPILIHASKACTRDEYEEAVEVALAVNPSLEGQIPSLKAIPRGGIVGKATLTDCVQHSASRWFFGPYGFVLSNPQPTEFQPCRGSLGFFRPQIQTAALTRG
jgi:hypothetical protein